jgi:hypothetical protein
MPVTRTRELTFVVSASAFVAVVSITAAMLAPTAPVGLPAGSSLSRAPSGSAAAYLTLQSIGHAVRRSYDPLPSLDLAPGSTVLILADPSENASNQDRRALQTFVAAGGTALVTGCAGSTFLSSASAGAGQSFAQTRTYGPRFPSPLSAGAPSIAMAAGCAPAVLGPRYLPLYGLGSDDVVWFSRVGRGLAVWWAGSTPIENRAIDEPGHLELLLNVVGASDREVVWDEFYHGQRRSLWSYLSRTPLPWGIAQMALAGLMAAAMFSRRRLPVRGRFVEARTSPLEFVETMAALYARAPSAGAATAQVRARLRRLLLEATGLSPGVTDARLAAAAAGRVSVQPDDLCGLLEAGASAGSDSSTSVEAALPLVRRMQAVAAALHGGSR